MIFLYTLVVYFLRIGLSIATPFQSKLYKRWRGKKNLFIEIQKHINSSSKTIWFHCASLGEFEQAKPLIDKTYKEFPNFSILLSFFSSSGYEIIKNYNKAYHVCYLPIDTPKNMHRFIEISRAIVLILVKYEFWPNMIFQAYKKSLPIYTISAVFRKNQLFFKSYSKFMVSILKRITHFFVQDENSKLLLNTIGIKKVTVCGDTRFDRVIEIKNSFKPLNRIEDFKDNQILIVAGSTWLNDEKVLIKWIKTYKSKCKILLALHEIHPGRILHLRSQLPKNHTVYSQASDKELKACSIMILDCIGLLKHSYGSADIAYIGGGFQKSGVHNVIEAATFGIPVLFGPIYHKSIEAKELLELKGAFSVNHLNDLVYRLDQLIKNPSFRNQIGQHAKNYVQEKTGATIKILNVLKKTLKNHYLTTEG